MDIFSLLFSFAYYSCCMHQKLSQQYLCYNMPADFTITIQLWKGSAIEMMLLSSQSWGFCFWFGFLLFSKNVKFSLESSFQEVSNL